MRMRIPWAGLGAFALVVLVTFDGGGYFPGPWGWTILGAAWAAGLALLGRRQPELSRPALATALLLAAFTAWTGLSMAWSLSVTQTALETQRVAVYASAFLAAALWSRTSAVSLLAGAWAAITVVCSWSLLTRLVPDRFGVYFVLSGNRLTAPVGYWNSLGLLAAIGALLALALASESPRIGRAFAGASLPLLVTTLYFTYSRGSWLALGIGLVVALAAERRRVRMLATLVASAPWVGFALWRASTSKPLTVANPTIGAEAHAGHRLVVVLLVLSAASALAVWLVSLLDERLNLSRRLVRPAQIAAVMAVVVLVAAVTVRYGAPNTIATKGWHAFNGSGASGSTLNGRLFSFSGSGRATQWRVAWRQAKAHPVAGTGAMTYEIWWNRLRPTAGRVRDVHNLYLQALAELGVIGLAILLAALGVPLVAGVVARGRPLAAGALGAYVAYLAHAIIDWDWEITGVTLPAILCMAVLASGSPRVLGGRIRAVVLAVAVVFAVGGLYTVAARIPQNRLDTAIGKQQWDAANRYARHASDLAPWSSEPWLKLGEAELNAGLKPQAHDAFRIAVNRDPNNWVAWWDLARASMDGEREDALLHVKLLNPLAPPAK